MSQLKDDLIAAKALIDTLETWRMAGSISRAISRFGGKRSDPRYRAMREALYESAVNMGTGANLTSFGRTHAHRDIIALFDRAIAAAP